MKRLYLHLSKPIEFGEWDENSLKKPMGWIRAKESIDKNYELNKLNVLTKKEVAEIKKKLRTCNK